MSDLNISQRLTRLESITKELISKNKTLNLSNKVLKEQLSTIYPYGTKVYLAFLTQSGTSSIGNLSYDFFPGGPDLTIGTTYEITDNTGSPDFTNVGSPDNEIGTKFCATGTRPASWGQAAVAYDSASPTVRIVYNTVGNIAWSYNSVGVYWGTCQGVFLDYKVQPITSGWLRASSLHSYELQKINDDTLALSVFDQSNQSPLNDVLNTTLIQILIFP